jgi:primosomal protein N' (replication factor Y)
MLTQILGRAGRGEKPGKAVIQTYHIDHYAVRFGAQQNFLKFYDQEIKIRQQLRYPPFTKLALIRIFSSDEKIAHGVFKLCAEIESKFASVRYIFDEDRRAILSEISGCNIAPKRSAEIIVLQNHMGIK